MMIGRNDGVKAARLLGEHCGVLKLTEEAHMQDKRLVILLNKKSCNAVTRDD